MWPPSFVADVRLSRQERIVALTTTGVTTPRRLYGNRCLARG
jgi:hypothetical protein